jgi:hypothetical protein
VRLDHITPRRFARSLAKHLDSPTRLSLVYTLFDAKSFSRRAKPTLRGGLFLGTSNQTEAGAHPRCFNPFPGGHSAVVPPDPIPNSEVKRSRADGSVACPCKSRSPPGALSKTLTVTGGGFSFDRARLGACRNRSPPGALSKNPHRHRWGFFFCSLTIHGRSVLGYDAGVSNTRRISPLPGRRAYGRGVSAPAR